MFTLKDLLHTGAYRSYEIERLLDPEHPTFITFDPVLGYELRDYEFNDGQDGILSSYVYHQHGGHRLMINYADRPCRLNTYGDSFTQGAQVSNGETWQEVLAAHFHEPIRNFGVGGYGVYQAYRRLLRTEAIEDLAAEYLILNIWDDDHLRNIDAARWVRVAWMCRDLPRNDDKDGYPVHGFPWAHIRYDLQQNRFVEKDGMCKTAEDLRKLVGKDAFYNIFKDDEVAHLYTLTQGGEAPIDKLEPLAEAFGLKLDLRNPQTRVEEAKKLHLAYGIRSTEYLLENLRDWCAQNGRKLMVLLSYDVPTVTKMIEDGTRFDSEFVTYLKQNDYAYSDTLLKAADEYKNFNIPVEDFIARYYVGRAGAQVFGHYNPAGNFWFAQAIKDDLINWMTPQPEPYARKKQ